MKKCSICRVEKPFEAFYTKKRGSGRESQCKACRLQSLRATRKTVIGQAASAWYSINHRAGNRDGNHPTYANVEVRLSKVEFINWYISAIAQWQIDRPGEKGTVDRIRNADHYELGNLQIATQLEQAQNRSTSFNAKAPPGYAWCSRCRNYKPVAEFRSDKNATTGLRSCCSSCSREKWANRKTPWLSRLTVVAFELDLLQSGNSV